MSMNKYGGVNDMPDGFTKTPLGIGRNAEKRGSEE